MAYTCAVAAAATVAKRFRVVLVNGGDDKFSVVTRIQKHLSWDHLHIRTVKLLTRCQRERETKRIVIMAIISRLSIESEAHVMRWRKDEKLCGATKMWCAPLKVITDASELRGRAFSPTLSLSLSFLSISFCTNDNISQKRETQMKLFYATTAVNCTVKIGNIYSLHNVIYIGFSIHFVA